MFKFVIQPTRKTYVKPTLNNLGDLRTLTLGGSPGSGESGNNAHVPLGGPMPPPMPPAGFPDPNGGQIQLH